MALPKFLSTLGNVARGVLAQINPFDNGQTYRTVQQQRQQQPQIQRPGQRPQQRTQTAPQVSIAKKKAAPQVLFKQPPTPQIKIAAPPQIKGPNASIAARVINQINPFDNGRTAKQLTPTNNRSVLGQLAHNGLTNFVGSALVKPVTQTVAIPVEATRSLIAQATKNVAAQRAAEQRKTAAVQESLPGQLANLAINIGKVGYNLPRTIQADITGGSLAPKTGNRVIDEAIFAATNPVGYALNKVGVKPHAPTVAQSKATNQGLEAFNQTPVAQLVSPAQRAIDATVPTARDASKKAGYDVNQGMAKTLLADPLLGAASVAGLAEGGIKLADSAKARVKPVYAADSGVPIPKKGTTRPASKEQNLAEVQNAGDRPATQQQLENAHNTGDVQSVKQIIESMNKNDPYRQSMESTFASDIEAANAMPKAKQRKFNVSVKNSDEVSPETQAATQTLTYTPKSNKVLTDNANTLLANNDLAGATKIIDSALAKPKGKLSDQDVANTITVAKAHDAAGDYVQASRLYDELATHLTESGRTVQAASILSNRTPEGLQYGALKALKKAGVEATDELKQQIHDAVEKVRSTQPGTEERTIAVGELQKIVHEAIPPSNVDKLIGIWKAGLLSGVRTQTGNALSNTTFGILHDISNIPATIADQAIRLATGKRTKTITLKGRASGLNEGVSKAKRYLKTGIDERATGMGNKFDVGQGIKFKNKALNTYVNGVFKLMGAADRPAYYSQLRNSLQDMALADGKTMGLKGKELKAHVKQYVENPPEVAFKTATAEAEKSVLANETFLGNVASRTRQAAEDINNPVGRETAKLAINVLAPFTKVPSAFISRSFDFTPVGAIREAAKQISARKLDQRALSTAIGEATTGSAIIYLGAKMAENGLLSGDYPNDPKEQARWKAEGIQPNAIKVGNKWLSMNYLGPIGALFGMGKNVVDTASQGEGATSAAINAIAGSAKTALGQSFLQGVSGALDAINDPQRYGKNFVRNQAGSVIPTLVNDVATATDQSQREVNNPGEAIQSRIPGLREGLMPAQDAFGNDLARKTSAINQLVNPLRPSDSRNTPLTDELDRLKAAGQFTFPTPIDKKITFDGQKTTLSDEQRHALQDSIGQAVQSAWDQAIISPTYRALPDDQKKQMLDNIASDVTAVQKKQFAAQNNVGQYDPAFTGKASKLSAKQAAMAEGGFDPANYMPGSSTVYSPKLSQESYNTLTKVEAMTSDKRKKYLDDPKNNLQYQLSKFENDDLSGNLSEVEKYKRQQTLGKLTITSNYSKNAQELYGLSKAQLNAYLKSHKVDDNTINELIAMDGDLYDAGFTSSLKFKYGLSSSSGVGSKAKKAKKAKQPKTINVPLPSFGSLKLGSGPSAKRAKASDALAKYRSDLSKIKVTSGGARPGGVSPIKIKS